MKKKTVNLVKKYAAKLPRCVGCYQNRYNQKSEGDGWNAPTDGLGCEGLENAQKCSLLVYYSSNDTKHHVLENTNSCWRNHVGYGTRTTATEIKKLRKEGKVY